MDLPEVLKNIDIIRIFKEEPFSVIATSDIEERLNLSHHPTFRRLKVLEDNSVLLKSKGGYILNTKSEEVAEIMKFLVAMEGMEATGKKKGRPEK
jgi:predicted transcriptional regulator